MNEYKILSLRYFTNSSGKRGKKKEKLSHKINVEHSRFYLSHTHMVARASYPIAKV